MSYACKTLITTSNELALREKRLSICLEADGFSFAETASGGALVSFGGAEGRHAATMTQVMADVKAFFNTVGIRPLGYGAMELVVMSNESVWVPDELYSAVANRKYLDLVGCAPESLLSCHSRELASTAVFSAIEHVVVAFKVAMPGVVVMHQHTKMAQLARLAKEHPMLLAHWRKGRVDVAAYADGRYIFGNTLSYTNDEEAAFHLVEVMKTYRLEGPATELLLCGDVDRERYARLRPYFPKVTLFNGTVNATAAEFRTLHTYRHALLLI